MKKVTIIFFTLFIILFLVLSVSSSSQGISLNLIGSNFYLSTGLTTQRLSPSVAYNSVDNEYIVVWFDSRNAATTGNDVFGQRVSAMGMLLDGNIQITDFMESQSDPFVTYNNIDNEYLVAWQSQFDGPGSTDFNDAFGRIVSGNGVLLSDAFRIFDGGLEISSAYNGSYNSINNEYLVTGRSFASGSAPGILGQIVSNIGSLVGSEIAIATTGAPAPNGQVIYNPNTNEYFATWRDQVEENLKGQRITANGILIGDAIVISPVFPESDKPTASVAFDPTDDRYLVVFGVFQEMEILGQFVSSSGELIGANFPIATGLLSRADPYVAFSSIDNSFVVVWQEADNIAGQLMSDDGIVIGDTLIIAQGTASGNPRLAYNSETSGFLVVWSDNRNISQGKQDIFAQLITVSGPIEADIKIYRKILNFKSKGKIIISGIKLPEEYDPHDIAKDSLELSIPSCSYCEVIYPTCGSPLWKRYLAFFPEQDLIDEIKTMNLDLPTNMDLKITGELNDGTPFEGLDTIRVIKRKKWTKRK